MTDYITAYGNRTNPYHREAVSLEGRIIAETTIDANGAIRWNSNNRVPPQDVVDFARFLMGGMVSIEASDAARKIEQDAFFAEYRKARANGPTDEERFEARAAFGPGVEIADVITGHKWRT